MKVRIKFAKYGVMKFIGHLDMMRFFQKAIRRADIDVRYSEGFSPHQIMSFAAPLGVGIESFGEYLDIEVLSMDSPEAMRQALNNVMVEGVEILSVNVLPDQAKNAMASVAAASYRLTMKEGSFPIDDLAEKIQAFYAQETIPYTKETKKSVIELDLKQGIYELGVNEEGAVHMLVNASSSGNIKPTMIFEKFCQFAGCEIPASAIQVTRLEIYTDLAQNGETRHLVPLQGF
ncbi:MAG: TIGR03936 family radical SAM-associated protein [Lachnospiraceae bacterium]|nr:TIGR03936 family radical SAM-associated protein [Lachnospiraceae bacterium]